MDLMLRLLLRLAKLILEKNAELDQELFDKLFGAGTVKSVTELRAKITEDAEKQFVQQADQKFLNDVTEYLVENTKFDLPTQFLQKWIQTAGEEKLDVLFKPKKNMKSLKKACVTN